MLSYSFILRQFILNIPLAPIEKINKGIVYFCPDGKDNVRQKEKVRIFKGQRQIDCLHK